MLKLTVGDDVFCTMDAPVGSRGMKGDECRVDCSWIQQRLDGRHYDYVKLYPGLIAIHF